MLLGVGGDGRTNSSGAGSDDKYTRLTIDPFVSYTNPKGHRITASTRYLLIFRKGNGEDPNAVSHQAIGDIQYQYRWKNMLTFTAGVPFSVGANTSNLYEGTRMNFNTAVYAQLEFVYKVLTLQGGLRYEVIGVDTFVIPGRPVFRAGVSVQAAKATFFRASWGQGYRVPTIGERATVPLSTGAAGAAAGAGAGAAGAAAFSRCSA